MKNIRLTRIAANPNHGVFGTWVLDGQPICVTLEPYHRSNTQNISCVPSGQYIMKRVDSPKYGNVWEVTNVQGRGNVLCHWGNWDENTQGCVLLGEKYSVLDGRWAISESKNAFNEFMELTKNETELLLTITEGY